MNSESTLSDALSEVDVAIAASNFERAIALTDELLAAYPDAVSVWQARARAFSAAGKPFQAAEAYGRILDVLPTNADAMAALAKSLSASGRRGAAKLLAQQALDYHPTDETLRSIAADAADVGNEPSRHLAANDAAEAWDVGRPLRGLARASDGSSAQFDRSVTDLRTLCAQRPDRMDVQMALAHALWREGSKIAAAEVCLSILDVLPDCLEAHALLLALWKEIGPPNLEQAHLEAIARLDPDHRCVKAVLGDTSPVEVADVPAIRPAQSQSERVEPPGEDEQSRTDWVDDLVAAASSIPQPLERIASELEITPASRPFEDDDILIVEEALDEFESGASRAGAEGAAHQATDADADAEEADTGEADAVETFLPLEWEEAEHALDDRPDDEDLAPAWLPAQPGRAADGFTPSRPQNIVPDAKDGVPAAIEPLEWEPEAEREDGDSGDSTAGAVTVATVQESDSRQPAAQPRVALSSFTPPALTPPVQPASVEEPSSAAKRGAVGLAAIVAARQAVQEGRWQDALTLYEKAILRSKGEQLDEIINDLETLVADQVKAADRFRLLGLAYMRKRDVDAALDAWQRAMALQAYDAE